MALSHAEQVAEATANRAAGVNPADRAAALDVVGDGTPQDPGAGAAPVAPPAEQPPQRDTPPARSGFDSKRNEISARFRTERVTADEPDDISDFARNGGLPQDFREAAGVDLPPPEGEAGA